MAYQRRLHVRHGYYLVRDTFRPELELLELAPESEHAESEIEAANARRTQYETQLLAALTRWRVRLHAHCWLSGSAWLFVEIRYAPLEWLMHSLRSSFSHYLRREMGITKPHLDRYRTLLVDKEEFFWDVVRYLLLLPQVQGVCKDSTRYLGSSATACVGKTVPPFLLNSDLLNHGRRRGIDTRAGLMRFFAERSQPGFVHLGADYWQHHTLRGFVMLLIKFRQSLLGGGV